ncbi:MAG: hypothetical protein BWY93_01625 [Euryarchaeota archaeon ADurb.BinA087]|nr:MAG: hypothetical protein BWY93_01625 [Euryarchaeota archaeon ADurb.BinA087]
MESGRVYPSISRQWRSRIGESHDYAVIRNDSIFRTGFHDRYVFESLHMRATKQLHAVMETYRDNTLDEIFHGQECDTYEGTCYCIPSRVPLDMKGINKAAIRSTLLSDLTLVYGIGRRKERELKAKGYATIVDLAVHRRFGKAARETMAILSGDEIPPIEQLVSRWLSPSHPSCLTTAGFYHPGDLIFIDIETLGIFSRPIILFGIAEIRSGELCISQYLLRDISEEVPAISAVMDQLDGDRVLISYNGKAFDIPYLTGRAAFYGRPAVIGNPHYDLLHFSRRRWRGELPDCRLVTLEQRILRTGRGDDIPGAMVPEFYEAFMTTGNPGPLVPIVTHNRQDLVSLARLFFFLQGECVS